MAERFEIMEKALLKMLEEKFGIPEKNVILQATHTHAGPTMYSRHEVFPKTAEYLDTIFHPALLKAAEEALTDLSPATLYIGKGKKDKVNKIDIVGFLSKKGNLNKDEIGRIDVKDHYAFVAISRKKVKQTLGLIRNEKIKGVKTIIEEAK